MTFHLSVNEIPMYQCSFLAFIVKIYSNYKSYFDNGYREDVGNGQSHSNYNSTSLSLTTLVFDVHHDI